MKLFCLKYVTNNQKRNTLYNKLEKIGIKHCLPLSLQYDYHVITPEKKIVAISLKKLDMYMFGDEHEVFEARNENEFINLIKQYITYAI